MPLITHLPLLSPFQYAIAQKVTILNPALSIPSIIFAITNFHISQPPLPFHQALLNIMPTLSEPPCLQARISERVQKFQAPDGICFPIIK